MKLPWNNNTVSKDSIEKQSKAKGGNPNWYKGMKSPNPKGRPKIGNSLAEKYRDAWSEILDSSNDYTVGDAIIDKVIEKALKGDMKAIEYLEARGFGKILDRIEFRKPESAINFDNLTAEELDNYEQLLDKLRGDTKAEDTD